jgi:hypothetical protein
MSPDGEAIVKDDSSATTKDLAAVEMPDLDPNITDETPDEMYEEENGGA